LVVEIVFETLERAGGHETFLMKFDLAVEVAFGFRERGARLRGLQAQLSIVERGEHLPSRHAIAFLHVDAADFAAYLGNDFSVGFRVERGGAAVHSQHFAAQRLRDFDGNRGLAFRGAVLCLGAGIAGDTVLGAGRNGEYERQDRRVQIVVCHARPLCLRL
jgi:hypothetical protein